MQLLDPQSSTAVAGHFKAILMICAANHLNIIQTYETLQGLVMNWWTGVNL